MTLHFASPWFLLALIPLLLSWVIQFRRKNERATLLYSNFSSLPEEGLHIFQAILRLTLGLKGLALLLLVVALARPQVPDREVLSGEGVDVMVALDMSASMNAVDLSGPALEEKLEADETPLNRFEIARDLLEDFVANRHEDRLGLVIFGRDAFLKFPLTLDYSRILTLLQGLILDNGERDPRTQSCTNQCTIQGGGTAIGDALGRSFQRLRKSSAKSRVIVLITDGTNEGGKLQPETVLQYIEEQAESDPVKIFSFLVGRDEETFVPRSDRFGRVTYQRPQRPFPTNPDLLRELAEKTGGQFYESYDETTFREHFKELERSEFQTSVTTQYREVFHWFAWLALLLLLLETGLRFVVWREFP